MTLSKALIKKMGKLLGVDATKLTAAIDDAADVDVDIPEVVVLTPDGKKKLESDKYEEGKTAGIEMEIKEYKKTNSLDFKGKDLTSLVTHLESLKDTDGRIKKLQENLTIAEKKALDAEEKTGKIEMATGIHNAIPGEYGGLSKRELQAIAEANGFEFKSEKGKIEPYRNGVRVRNERDQKDVEVGPALKEFFEVEKKMTIGTPAVEPPKKVGRGGGNEPATGGANTSFKRSEIEKAFKEANPDANINGMEYASYFAGQTKAAKEAWQTVTMD